MRSLAATFIAATLCACGGGPGTPVGSVVNAPGSGDPPPPPAFVPVKLTVTVPSERGQLRPNYVSPNTKSLGIGLVAVDGTAVSGAGTSVVDTVLSGHNCARTSGATVCTATISGSPGNDVFAVTTYDGTGATGAVLSVGSVTARVGGRGVVQVDKLSIAIGGVIASLRLRLSPNAVPRGKPASVAVTLDAYDATGAQIVGPSAFASPIAVTIQGDASHSFLLHDGKRSAATLDVVKPPAGLRLSYNGDRNASPVTLAATVSGPSQASASAALELHGKRPPPPVGTIYALNVGSRYGRAATVTEYDGRADGNAAPVRVLQLDAKLYARSIAVDASGQLYVGYLDSQFGFSPGTGQPDKGNLVAVYARGASGNDKPVAELTADPKTNTLLFPIAMAFDPAADLVTYGATSVDGNAGDAMLIYAPGSSGASAPAHAWNFASPVINYAGPSGLALDSQGNFYLSGALKSALGPSYGVFVAAASDQQNPSASVARTIPWDTTTEITPGYANDVALDPSGEVFVSNFQTQGSGSGTSCQGRANVFAAGAGGGITDVPPLRVLVLQGVETNDPTCASSRNPLEPYFPAIVLYGATLFVADDFNDAIGAFSSSRGGNVAPSNRIAGAQTQLDAPIALTVSPLSGGTSVRPVTGASNAPDSLLAQPHHSSRALHGSIKE